MIPAPTRSTYSPLAASSPKPAAPRTGAVDGHARVDAGVLGDLPRRLLEGPGEHVEAGPLVAFRAPRQGLDGSRGAEEGDAPPPGTMPSAMAAFSDRDRAGIGLDRDEKQRAGCGVVKARPPELAAGSRAWSPEGSRLLSPCIASAGH
jgi:hypothetical protein